MPAVPERFDARLPPTGERRILHFPGVRWSLKRTRRKLDTTRELCRASEGMNALGLRETGPFRKEGHEAIREDFCFERSGIVARGNGGCASATWADRAGGFAKVVFRAAATAAGEDRSADKYFGSLETESRRKRRSEGQIEPTQGE